MPIAEPPLQNGKQIPFLREKGALLGKKSEKGLGYATPKETINKIFTVDEGSTVCFFCRQYSQFFKYLLEKLDSTFLRILRGCNWQILPYQFATGNGSFTTN